MIFLYFKLVFLIINNYIFIKILIKYNNIYMIIVFVILVLYLRSSFGWLGSNKEFNIE